MTIRNEVYRCPVCGNIVEVLSTGRGTLVCCGKPMELQEENTRDAAREKHVPVIKKTAQGYQVSVGEVAHPMEEKHFIQWIELIADGQVLRRFLEPGDAPTAEFQSAASEVTARAYCNLHGNWKAS